MMTNTMKRRLFFISDGTGISVETLGKSLITQFQGVEFEITTLRFINTIEKAENAVQQINHASAQSSRPLVFSTIVDRPIRNILQEAKALFIDFFQNFIDILENELDLKASGTIGLSHAVLNDHSYSSRMESVNFALHYDDGQSTRGYPSADIIMVGVSRCGKTPTCLYLAMQYGLRAANYPITEEDFTCNKLPESILPYKDKLFGLTISAERLQLIRSKRRPNSRYSELKQCQWEINQMEEMFKKENIPFLNSTHLSVEELSTLIMAEARLQSKM